MCLNSMPHRLDNVGVSWECSTTSAVSLLSLLFIFLSAQQANDERDLFVHTSQCYQDETKPIEQNIAD